MKYLTRPGVDKVKPKGCLKVLLIDWLIGTVLECSTMFFSTWETCPTLDAGILKMVQHVRFMMFSLNMVDYPMSFLCWDFFAWQVGGTTLWVLFWDPSFISCLKVLVLGLKGLGVRVWGQGFTNSNQFWTITKKTLLFPPWGTLSKLVIIHAFKIFVLASF